MDTSTTGISNGPSVFGNMSLKGTKTPVRLSGRPSAAGQTTGTVLLGFGLTMVEPASNAGSVHRSSIATSAFGHRSAPCLHAILEKLVDDALGQLGRAARAPGELVELARKAIVLA